VTHPWAQTLRVRFGPAEGEVEDLRVEPGLVTGGGASLSAPVIPAGVWAAVDVKSSSLAQTLEHTWEEPLVPEDVTRAGSPEAVEALSAAFADAVEEDPSLLLRWRGHGERSAGDDAWRGGALPELPESRRPPESVPNRFGASGISASGDDLVEKLVRVYRAFEG
jgi:hypothetical protein